VLRFFRKRWIAVLLALVALAGIGGGVWYFRGARPATSKEDQPAATVRLQAPPDLQKLREPFIKGRDALQRDEGAEAVRHLASFDFGPRAVEEYRLYYLANGHELAGNAGAARAALATLWRREPKLIHADEASLKLGALYAKAGDYHHAAQVYATVAARTKNPAIGAQARWNAIGAHMATGDVSGAMLAARDIVIHNPATKEADDAIAFVRAIDGLNEGAPLRLTHHERLTRAKAYLLANQPQNALGELELLAKVAGGALASDVQLQRGIALQRLKRFEDSNKVLEPLTSGEYKIAIPALRAASRNYGVLSASINPNVTKIVKERKQVGTIKQRVGKGKKRRTVTKPKFAIVSRQVKLIDLAKKNKKDEYERLASERLKDVLSLKVDDDVRLETLEALAARAEAKNQSEYLRQVVPQILKLDPTADPALQYFWDRGWAAYTRGDLASAQTLFRFIADTYTNPNVKRQSEYWFARTIERAGKKVEANAIYQRLANAPYLDIYAIYSVQRGAKHTANNANPLERDTGQDWSAIAEREMPKELRLAYELTALAAMREAFAETRANASRKNVRFAEALSADVYYRAGNLLETFRSLRRAWPSIATPDQDSVPPYFLKMYYPMKYDDSIRKWAEKQKLDPHLVQGLIHQESYYNPRARSHVGATGLMQLMPPTAREHSRTMGISFSPGRLEDPDTNIRLGTHHLRMLLNMFGGREQFAIAAYNAGQGNVLKWRRGAPRKPLDEFLESIPFDETRGYVKRVTMLKASYKRMAP
jgi:soluble lytic murein transglycosylase-like protein/TolA-binding protein